MLKRIRLLAALVMAGFSLLPVAALAEAIPVFSGTGFFVSNSGHIITNHHVITGCDEVMLRGAFPDTTAEVIAVDEKNDLALLKADIRARRVATIRHPGASTLRVGEPVLVMGYPKESFQTGQYQIAEAKVEGTKGPMDEPHWIQFSDSAQQGNSGGPLLDASGNVAGVIVGKTTLMTYVSGRAKHEVVKKSDVAISLPVLIRFLEQNYVSYRVNGSYTFMMPSRVEELAKAYIVNLLCPQSPK